MADTPYDSATTFAQRIALDPYAAAYPKFLAVVDTDALLSSIDNQCQTGWKSRICQLSASRCAVVYAEDHVFGETYRGLPRLARGSRSRLEDLRACFEEEYLPGIRWVQTDGRGIADHRVSLVADATDVPTAELASLIAPCVVLSGDRHLRDPGIAPADWRSAAGQGADLDRAVGDQQGVVMAGGLPVVAVIGGGVAVGDAVGLPRWASVFLLAAVAALVLRNPERRRAVGRATWLMVECLLEQLGEALEREQAAALGLRVDMLQPADEPSLKQRVATVLGRASEPLLAQEVAEQVEILFPSSSSDLASIRDVLRESSEFVVVERYRWQLGRLSGPWAGRLNP